MGQSLSLIRGVTVLEGPLLPGITPEDFIVAIRVEWGVDVDHIDAGIGQFPQLFQVVATIDGLSIERTEERSGRSGGTANLTL